MPIDPFLLSIPRLLEVAHVAHRLGVSQEFVRRLIRDGKLQAIRLEGSRWRVEPAVLEAYLQAQQLADAREARGHEGPHPIAQGGTR